MNQGLKELRRLAMDHTRRKYASVPDHALVISKYSDKTANGLTRAIIDYIRFCGGQAERISCTGRILDKRKQYVDTVGFHRMVGSVQWIRSSMQKGTSDISAVFNGVSLKIEVEGRPGQTKSVTGRLSTPGRGCRGFVLHCPRLPRLL